MAGQGQTALVHLPQSPLSQPVAGASAGHDDLNFDIVVTVTAPPPQFEITEEEDYTCDGSTSCGDECATLEYQDTCNSDCDE